MIKRYELVHSLTLSAARLKKINSSLLKARNRLTYLRFETSQKLKFIESERSRLPPPRSPSSEERTRRKLQREQESSRLH
jgi:hypothetical protein